MTPADGLQRRPQPTRSVPGRRSARPPTFASPRGSPPSPAACAARLRARIAIAAFTSRGRSRPDPLQSRGGVVRKLQGKLVKLCGNGLLARKAVWKLAVSGDTMTASVTRGSKAGKTFSLKRCATMYAPRPRSYAADGCGRRASMAMRSTHLSSRMPRRRPAPRPGALSTMAAPGVSSCSQASASTVDEKPSGS